MALAHYDWEQDLFAPFFGGHSWPAAGQRTNGQSHVRGIPLDVVETNDSFQIKADIPGVHKQDIKLSVDADVLSLSVQSSTDKNEEKNNQAGYKVHRHERSQSFVRRSLRLPEHADLAKVSAKYIDGVLHVEVPKTDEKQRTHSVAIE